MATNNDPTPVIHGLSPNVYVGLMNLLFLVPSCGWIISIIFWAMGKDQSEYVNTKGKNLINWMISCLIWGVTLSIATVILGIISFGTGFTPATILFAAFGIYILVCPVIAGIKAINEEEWSYPLTLRFLK